MHMITMTENYLIDVSSSTLEREACLSRLMRMGYVSTVKDVYGVHGQSGVLQVAMTDRKNRIDGAAPGS